MATKSPGKNAGRRHDRGDGEGKAQSEPLTIVGIGASAGGLSALKSLLKRTSKGQRVAYVVVIHLSPNHESHLAGLLQAECELPVQQVSRTTRLEADHVYVIPPNANLNTIDTHLRLSKLEKHRRERAPIDHFFRTLADTHDGSSVGVVLTGSGSDGTLGIRWIKEKGGVTIAQDPEEAEYDGMPRSAIDSGFVDLVLPLERIPDQISRIAATRPRLPMQATATDLDDEDARALQRIFAQIRAHTRHDFSQYKRSTILRRIGRRMQLHQLEHLADYAAALRDNREEVLQLFDDLLINVTEFFRDEHVFAHLAEEVIPELLRNKGPDDSVRVWSVGCSTGEEAYSLAILLLEALSRSNTAPPRVQVFASDLHEHSLKTAREGVYPDSIAASMSRERLNRWFVMENGSYRVRREVREAVVFAPHILLRDPPFSRLDLVVCRNLMIYLQRDVQQDVLGLFHYALNPGGLLLVGTAESVDGHEAFEVVDKHHCLYARRNVPVKDARLPVFPLSAGGAAGSQETADRTPVRPSAGYGALHAQLVEQYAPPSILINHNHDVVHYSSHAGRFLQHPGGDPTTNVLKLVVEPLRIELRAALHSAQERGESVRSRPISVTIADESQRIVLRVRHLDRGESRGHWLVIFDDVEEAPGGGQGGAPDPAQAATVRELDAELELTRQRLQSLIEEYETGQEEMKASNEELQSANEELRSTLEELETSKEELHSMNEELSTVNEENRNRVEELTRLSNDLQNLLVATNIATMFLDRDLRIIRFTPQTENVFNILPTDRGRPLSDLTHRLGDTSLAEDARKVLADLSPIEREVDSDHGRSYLTRVMPYRAANDRIGGVVMTLVDITERKRAEDALRASEEQYRTLFDSIDEGFCVLEVIFGEEGHVKDCRFLEANPAFEKDSGFPRAVGRTMREIAPQHEARWIETCGEVLRTGRPVRFEAVTDARGRVFNLYAFRTERDGQQHVAVLFSDVTEYKRSERQLIQAQSELEERVTERTRQLDEQTARLRAMARELAAAEHRERKRLAAMLHDELQQYLVAIKLQLQTANQERDRGRLSQRLEACLKLADDSLACSRNLTERLRPPVLDEQGLTFALRWLADATAQWYGLEVRVEAEDNLEAPLSEEVETTLFDAVRELLLNAAKHSGVMEARVRAEVIADRFRIVVSDDGVGFDPAALERRPGERGGFGLRSIPERLAALGGVAEISSRAGQGTSVRLEVPLVTEDDEPEPVARDTVGR